MSHLRSWLMVLWRAEIKSMTTLSILIILLRTRSRISFKRVNFSEKVQSLNLFELVSRMVVTQITIICCWWSWWKWTAGNTTDQILHLKCSVEFCLNGTERNNNKELKYECSTVSTYSIVRLPFVSIVVNFKAFRSDLAAIPIWFLYRYQWA